MKLLIVAAGNFFSNYGGGQVYVKNLVDELIHQKEKARIELSLLSIHDSFSELVENKKYKEIPLYEIHPKGDIQSLIQSIQPDIVHAHGEKSKVTKSCKDLGIPCIVTAHHGGICCPAGSLLNCKDEICHIKANTKSCLPCYLRNIRTGSFWYAVVKHIPISLYAQIGKSLKNKPFIPFLSPIGEAVYSIKEKLASWESISQNATTIIAPSVAIKDSLVVNGCNVSKVTVLPHGIPIPLPTNTPSFDKNGTIKFFYVGRICYVKGIHVMLEAFSSIRNRNIELHIIGGADNKVESRYQKRLKKKYLSDKRIIWHGKIDPSKVNLLIADYHCLIHPTICMEIFGLNIAEAMAQHKYVIATRCGGPEMQIENPENGSLCPPNNIESLRKAIALYIYNPKQSSGAPQNISSHIEELVKIYKASM